MLGKVKAGLILGIVLVSVLASAQSPVMELAYFQAPSTHSATTDTVASSSPLKYFVLVCGWGSIDPDGNPAHYTWTTCENSINDYLTAYSATQCAKQCIQLVFSPAADISPNSSTFTPTYVMNRSDLTVCECSSYAGSGGIAAGNGCQTNSAGGDGGTASPVPFSAGFSTPYNAFIANAVAHILKASYISHIASITFGGQRGGELAPTCSGQVNTFFSLTNSTLTTSMQGAIDSFDSSFRTASGTSPSFLLFNGIACIGINQPSTGNFCSYADAMAATHAKYNVGLRVTCARATDLSNYQGGAPTCGDWVLLASQYALPLDMQDSTQSDPSGGTCTVGGQASKVGNLTSLIAFVMQHRGKATRFIYESLSTDLNGAYAGTINACWPAACGPSGYVGGCPNLSYDAQFRAAALGQPYGTMVIGGKVSLQ